MQSCARLALFVVEVKYFYTHNVVIHTENCKLELPLSGIVQQPRWKRIFVDTFALYEYAVMLFGTSVEEAVKRVSNWAACYTHPISYTFFFFFLCTLFIYNRNNIALLTMLITIQPALFTTLTKRIVLTIRIILSLFTTLTLLIIL